MSNVGKNLMGFAVWAGFGAAWTGLGLGLSLGILSGNPIFAYLALSLIGSGIGLAMLGYIGKAVISSAETNAAILAKLNER